MRKIALQEYVDKLEIGKKVQEAFGIPTTEESDSTAEKVGTSRLGSSSLFENIGATLLIFTVILLILFLIVYGIYRLSKRYCNHS